jgi:hypothetical protein
LLRHISCATANRSPRYLSPYIPLASPVLIRDSSSPLHRRARLIACFLLDRMNDSPEPGHSEPTSLDKADYVNETEKQPEINVDELEPVVTPKTWVVVGVSTLTPHLPILRSIDATGRSCRWAMAYPSGPFLSWPPSSLKSPRVSETRQMQSGSFLLGPSPSPSAS